MTELADRDCIPCKGGEPPLSRDEVAALHGQLSDGWEVVNDHHLVRRLGFPDFATALAFTNRIGAVAEEQGHHPDITLGWGRVEVTIWTHAIEGLSESDFVLAAKIERLLGQN